MKKDKYQRPIIKIVEFLVELGFAGSLRSDKTVTIDQTQMNGNQQYGEVNWNNSNTSEGFF